MAGVERLQQIGGLAAPHLADDDVVGSVAERVPHQVADRYGRLGTDGSRLEAQAVRALDPELERVLDGDDPLLLGKQFDQGVQQRGLARAGASGHQDVAPGPERVAGDKEHLFRQGPLADEVFGGERAAPEPADGHGHVGAGRRSADGHAGAVVEPCVENRPGRGIEPERPGDVDRRPVERGGGERRRLDGLELPAAFDPDVAGAVDHQLGDLRIFEHGLEPGQQQPRPTPARALSETERGEVFDTLCSERFVDRSPAEVVATLLDEEVYLCSERTMYRVLASEVPVQERRAQRTHPEYKKPELMATAPNQVWSWDITRLLGPKKWSYYYLYVIMDIYSRYVVGWMVADRENSALAGRLIQQSCLKHGVQPRVLTLHSDRGAPMTSQCTAQLLADLGVTRSLSRPQVSDDNPFSEAQFKTLKYHPSFPGRFGDQGQAKTFCRSFFRWYNAEHRHGGISMLTPEQVHFGNADQVIAGRKSVLREAWAAHPERFVRGVPKPKPLPEAVFINPPIPSLTTQDIAL